MPYTKMYDFETSVDMFAINLPNLLSILRIILIPVLAIAYYWPSNNAHAIAAGVFFIVCFSDWLDGYLARKLNQESKFGAFLDPVADKLTVSIALVILVESFATPIIAVPAGIIIGREIVISALREWMAELGLRTTVRVSYLGKVKTTLQMLAILFLLSQKPELSMPFVKIGFTLLYISVLLTIWSMFIYLHAAYQELKYKKM